MKVTYKCKKCGTFEKDYKSGEKPRFSEVCPVCGESSPRTFGGSVTTTSEDPSVSGAIQMMLYSRS